MQFTQREWGIIKSLLPEDEDHFTFVLDAVMKIHAMEHASLSAGAYEKQESGTAGEHIPIAEEMKGPHKEPSPLEASLEDALASFG